MEKNLNSDVIKATQSSLGKYVKRPPLSEKLLKKPPFRFLHDIVTTVLKTTGFFEGLFEEEELVSDNVKERDSKIQFLTKVVLVVGFAIGKSLSVKPSKIVAGQEPEKTNELLQCLAEALDSKLSSDEAVKKYKEGAKVPQPAEKKKQDSTKTAKKINEPKKLTSRSSEKLTTNRKETSEKSQTNTVKDKANISKSKQRETSTVKKEKESPPKKTSQQSKAITKNNSVERKISEDEKQESKIITSTTNEHEDVANNKNNDGNDDDSGISHEQQDYTDNSKIIQQKLPHINREESGKLNSSYTIAENELNSSLSSQDLMEVDNDKTEENLVTETLKAEDVHDKVSKINLENEPIVNSDHEKVKVDSEALDSMNDILIHEPDPQIDVTADRARSNYHDTRLKSVVGETTTGSVRPASVRPASVRPASVRPSSSRPGAPRLREKNDNIIAATENLLLGKVNIIAENAPNEEEEETSIIIVEQPAKPLSTSTDHVEQLQTTLNQHGHLVQQILDSQKEFSQVTGKTEIEWQFGAQKAREAVNQEIEQLRFNIQALSRVANPLGKLLDHIQEDVEVMRQELQQWTKTYEEASKELLKQKSANEDSLFPLRTKLKQLDADVGEKHDKINDLKIVIHKNSSRIEKLLASGNVQ